MVKKRFLALVVVNIFTYTRPNHSEVGAIDSTDQLEHVFYPYYMLEVREKISETGLRLLVLRNWLKMSFFGVLGLYKQFPLL